MADPLRVLYVDDEPGLLDIGKLFLEREGTFAVDTLTSARQALEQMKTERYDAIISDYQMPEMDGIAFLKQLKASGNTTPFIIFTGRGREEVVVEALNSGADFYLQKGGEPKSQFAELAHKIQTAVARKRTEKRAKDTERRLYDIINFLPDATFAIDMEGTVIAWNRAMEEMTGAKSSEIVGKDNYEYGLAFYNERRPMLIDLVLAPDTQFEKDKYLYTSHDSTILTAETTLEKPDGHRIHLWGKASLLFDESGNLTGAIESIRDITDRVKAEKTVQESEAKFKTLFESAGDAIFIMDHNVFLDCNKRAEEMYCRSRDQMIGQSPAEFSPEHQPDRQPSAEMMKGKINAAFSGENRFFEWTHIHPDGTPFIVEVSLNRFMVRDIWYLQAIIRDITDRKQNENQTALLSTLTEKLLGTRSLKEQLALVCESCVTIFEADFARIWLIKDADHCERGCRHASVTVGPEVCRNRTHCLHLMVSSGRYTHIDGGHRRVPFGCYKIGRVASGEEPFFITNDVVHDPRVHDHTWAQSLGLVSFAGFRLLSVDNKPVGVLALFKKREILPREEKLLVDLANTLSQVIISGLAEEELLKKNEELSASYEQIAAGEEELRENLDEITRAEAALRESEEQSRTLLSTMPDIVMVHQEGIIVYANQTAIEKTGFSEEELIGSHLLDNVVPEFRDSILRNMAQRAAGEPVGDYEVDMIHKSGALRHVIVRTSPLVFNRIPSVVMILIDITERKQEEVALRESENLYRTIFETTGAATIIIENDTTITRANAGFAALSGFPLDELEGKKSWTEFVVPEDLEQMKQYHHDRRNDPSGEIRVYEFRFVNREGEIRHCINNVSVIPGTTRSVASVVDITERKRAENELETKHDEIRAAYEQLTAQEEELRAQYDMLALTEAEWESTFNAISDWITMITPDGRILRTNKAAESLFGESTGQVLGLNCFELVHGAECLNDDCPRKRMLVSKKREITEIPMREGNGWLQVTVDPILNSAGEVISAVHIVRDISERMRSQKAMVQAKKKLNLLNYVTFSDIQNMIFSLSGYQHLAKEMVKEGAAGTIIGKQDEILQKISHSLKFAQSFQDLGLKPPRWQNVNQVFLLAISHLDFLRIHHTVQLDGLEVFADPLLEQVFQILADNTLTHGKTATHVTLRYAEGPESVTLFFEDDGAGIPADAKEKIFLPDFQKKKGVGLFLAREILDITGITIRETGEPGKGARFEMAVPKGAWK